MSVNESSNSFSLAVSPACMDLVPYVPREQALGLQRGQNEQAQNVATPKQTGSFGKVSTAVANCALNFLEPEDLPAFACTSRANQELAVSQCFRRMGDCTEFRDFRILINTLTDCTGKKRAFGPQDLIERTPGTWKLREISLCHSDYPGDEQTNYPLLGDTASNARLAAKLPNLARLTFAGECPDLSPFAKECTQLSELTFRNSDLYVDEPMQGQFSRTLRQVTLLNCDQPSNEGLQQIRKLGPEIETLTMTQKRPGKKSLETVESVKPASAS